MIKHLTIKHSTFSTSKVRENMGEAAKGLEYEFNNNRQNALLSSRCSKEPILSMRCTMLLKVMGMILPLKFESQFGDYGPG
jgi:hypothetical protein